MKGANLIPATEQTGHAHHHEHGTLDPHIWRSPPLVKIEARTMLHALQEIDRSH